MTVTRFAPSPTGYLHIGGARTALFNWLLARQQGGKMLLRIEDTDRERSTDEAIAAIIDGMKWLGLDWDGEVVYQFSRADRHREVVEALLANGAAYKCYASTAELDEMRRQAVADKRPFRYDGRWRNLAGTQAEEYAIAEGRKPVVRLKVPREGETTVVDKVRGEVAFPNKDLDDFVLLRSDGTPTYMLAVVVDDHDMGVTDVIRGDDHFTNAARQSHIYRAMGWDVPTFAHIPLIHGADGAKMSKRDGAIGVDAYRAMGYLPEAVRNYLARLGWSHGDQEFFSTPELIDAFSVEEVHHAPARFDFAKLDNINGHYMRSTPDDALMAIFLDALPYLPGGKAIAAQIDPWKYKQILQAMSGLKERSKTLVELLDGVGFLFAQRPIAYDAKAFALLSPGAKSCLSALLPRFAALPDWTVPALEGVIKSYVAEIGVKLGSVAQPLRAALTGRSTSPGIFDVMAVLGRDETLGRIKDAIDA